MSDVFSTTTSTRSDASQRILGALAVAVGGVGLIKFLGLLAVYGPAQSPWGFLLVLVTPFLAGRLLLQSHPRMAAAVIGVFAALLAAVCVVALLQGIEPYWGDYLLIFVGGPLALAATPIAVRVWRGR